MWQQNYIPLGSLALSAAGAALPLFVLLYLLGIRRTPAWKAALAGLAMAALVALLIYRMPAGLALSAAACGAAFGLLPIGWIVFTAILLYRIVVDTGKFEIIKDSIGSLTSDRRLQALLVAFSFGAFLEGAAGFGAPVAVAAAMLTGLGFSPFYAAAICLLANTAPVAFGSIGIPVITLEAVTGLPLMKLSAGVGRICAPISVLVPAYLIGVMGGWRAMKRVLAAILACGVSFAATQLLVSNFMGPQLTDILGSLVSMSALVLLLLIWKPKDSFELEGGRAATHLPVRHPASKILLAWAPYGILVVMVLLWGAFKTELGKTTLLIPWPHLHEQVIQMPPVVPSPTPYRAIYRFEWLAAAGTACLFASILAAFLLRVSPLRFFKILGATGRQLLFSELTIASVLALAYLMNYCGATATLGLAFATTGALFPFFSALLGWLGAVISVRRHLAGA